MFLGLIFIMLPLLLFPINLINHFKKHQTGLPQWSYSFLVTIVPILICPAGSGVARGAAGVARVFDRFRTGCAGLVCADRRGVCAGHPAE